MLHRLPRCRRAILLRALALGALLGALSMSAVALASNGKGSGQGRMAALSCGAQVTSSVTLTSDIGPCPSSTDGLDVMASGITIDLNGHSIIGTNTTNTTVNEPVGIMLMNVHDVTITGPGTIEHFDAGVAVNGGQDNTIRKLTVKDNVAHVLLTGGVDPSNPEATPCDYGDGILTDNSNGNVIADNFVTGNGPFDGIALVDASSYNQVVHNVSNYNDVANIEQAGDEVGQSGPCGPFGASGTGPGRPHQDFGLRIEGPGATHNTLADNTTIGNLLEGIGVFSNICPNNSAGIPPTPPNTDNTVIHNLVKDNGTTVSDGLDGIGVLEQGPPGVVCPASRTSIIGNTSDGNNHDGIFLAGRGSSGNLVRNNTTDDNPNDGIELSGPAAGLPGVIDSVVRNNEAHGNGSYDGFDGTPGCGSNEWKNNRFTTVNQPCVGRVGGGR
jgi:hypothetical protein